MSELPSSWAMATVADVAEMVSGQAPPGSSYNRDELGLPLYQGKTAFTDLYVGPARLWTVSPSKLAEPGDILLSVRAPVGPTNLATSTCAIGRGLCAIRGAPGVKQR